MSYEQPNYKSPEEILVEKEKGNPEILRRKREIAEQISEFLNAPGFLEWYKKQMEDRVKENEKKAEEGDYGKYNAKLEREDYEKIKRELQTISGPAENISSQFLDKFSEENWQDNLESFRRDYKRFGIEKKARLTEKFINEESWKHPATKEDGTYDILGEMRQNNKNDAEKNAEKVDANLRAPKSIKS